AAHAPLSQDSSGRPDRPEGARHRRETRRTNRRGAGDTARRAVLCRGICPGARRTDRAALGARPITGRASPGWRSPRRPGQAHSLAATQAVLPTLLLPFQHPDVDVFSSGDFLRSDILVALMMEA